MRSRLLILLTALLLFLTACNGNDTPSGTVSQAIPDNAIQISIIYAPESDDYLKTMIPAFNESYRNGVNPVTGERLAAGERPIFVTGQSGSSGTVMQQIVNAVSSTGSSNIAQPTIFSPSVSHWLALANYQTGRELFDLANSPATALAPVVMAIWQSRLQAIQNTIGRQEIGWADLLDVLQSPNGWQDYGIVDGRRTVYYGHTDPYISSTALSTLIAEYYAAARANGFTGRRLGMDEVQDTTVQAGVREIETLIRHYSRRTTEFRNYIAQGPDYLDFVALEENDLISINRGLATFQPPEPLIALYPSEGTFWHEHPFAVPNAPWVTPEQRTAARVFADYILMPAQQEVIMSFGFRPANPAVPFGFPFEEAYGVTREGPPTVLDVPDPAVVSEIQESWAFVKKQADIMLVIDVSGSMAQQGKIDQAKQAALAFLDTVEGTNRIGLAVFSSEARILVPLDVVENNVSRMREAINGLVADGGTALYDSLIQITGIMDELPESNRIRAIILLSDGEDTSSNKSQLPDVIRAIEASYNDLNPVIVVPVGYGTLSTDLERVLKAIADSSNTIWIQGNPDNIRELLELISSFF